MTNKLRLAALKIIDPLALEQPLMASLLAHEARLASDPAIQERNRKIKAEVRAEMRPALITGVALGILVQLVIVSIIAWYFGVHDPAPEFTIPFVLSLAVMDFGIWRALTNL